MSQSEALVIALLGSGEFEPWAEPVDRWLIERARTGKGKLLVLPTASAPEGEGVFDSWAEKGLGHYQRLGIDAEVLPLKTRDDAEDPHLAAAVEDASAVFFSGGNPAYLASVLAGTRFWQAVLQGLARGLAFGGCSAGAHALGERAVDSTLEELSPDMWKAGLALFPGACVAPHWDALDTFIPGFQAFIADSIPISRPLLAIDEETALIGDGRSWTVLGRSSAHLRLDGSWLHAPADADLVCNLRPAFGEMEAPRRPAEELAAG